MNDAAEVLPTVLESLADAPGGKALVDLVFSTALQVRLHGKLCELDHGLNKCLLTPDLDCGDMSLSMHAALLHCASQSTAIDAAAAHACDQQGLISSALPAVRQLDLVFSTTLQVGLHAVPLAVHVRQSTAILPVSPRGEEHGMHLPAAACTAEQRLYQGQLACCCVHILATSAAPCGTVPGA